MTIHYDSIKIASKPENAGHKHTVPVGGDLHYVEYVPYGHKAQITFQKYTKDHSGLSARPYVTSFSAFGSLQAAVTAIVKRRLNGAGA